MAAALLQRCHHITQRGQALVDGCCLLQALALSTAA
jgi:hypothetical protein